MFQFQTWIATYVATEKPGQVCVKVGVKAKVGIRKESQKSGNISILGVQMHQFSWPCFFIRLEFWEEFIFLH